MTDEPKKEKGYFGTAVKKAELDIAELRAEMAALTEQMTNLEEKLDKFGELRDPEDQDYLWQNFEQLVEIVSALRRTAGFSPLAEFEGTKQRRRKQERAAKETSDT